MGRILWQRTWCMHVFSKKITKICFIFWKNAGNKCFRRKYRQLPANSGQIFTFSTHRYKLLTKNLAHIKVYTYFNIGDAKTLAKLKKKYSKLPKTCSYPLLSTNFLDFFASLVLNFSQVSKTLGYRDKFWTK